jgi:outer membrane biosynthesis protein TonB
MKLCEFLLWLITFATLAASVNAQQAAGTLPEVTDHATPVYPPLARQARIQGRVHLQITTDGHAVIDVASKDGHPLLAGQAEANVRTWKFVDHVPGTFEVTFKFGILKDKSAFLEKPGIVDIAVVSPQDNEGKLDYTLPTSWIAQLKGVKGNIEAPLSLWTYGHWLRGFALSPTNRQRPIRNTHQDGDMIGFDATLDDSYGQRLKFSLIGRKSGDKIKGIFLDYWGAAGTWTAMRATQSTPDTCAGPSASAEQNVIAVPEITEHRQPNYPWLPFEARIQGQVRLRASADNYCVAKVTIQSGDPLLAEAAEANVRTWWFAYHSPGTFEVTFIYRLLEPGVTFLEEPGIVEISEVAPVVNTSSSYIGEPEVWKAQFASARANMQATFSFPYGGSLEDGVVDTRGKKNAIRQSHQDGDMLGFDATLTTDNGQPIRVSLIGKRTGNQMKGVFLDFSGMPGTWTAHLSPPSTP